MTLIFKIVGADEWRDAEARGVFEGSSIDRADGYIHFSSAEQAAETAARHFVGRKDLMLAAVETEPLGDKLKWEPSRGGALFPHLYGPLPLAVVRWVRALPLGPDDRHIFGSLDE
jgi:uncharacterized protein (DUF952 family)